MKAIVNNKEKKLVLIVEDNEEQKIGKFKDELVKKNFEVIIAENLSEAQEIFDKRNNDIDTIILDYYFPKSELKDEDDKDNTYCSADSTPNGINFLKDNSMIINIKQIPIIINTNSDDETRDKYLKKVDTYNMKLYKCSEKRLLSDIANNGGIMLEECLKFIEDGHALRKSMRESANAPKKPSSFGPFLRDSKGNIIGYR